MKKPREMKRLSLNRETLTKLDRLEGGQLGQVAGGTTTGGSSCTILRCTCPPP